MSLEERVRTGLFDSTAEQKLYWLSTTNIRQKIGDTPETMVQSRFTKSFDRLEQRYWNEKKKLSH